MPIKSVKIKISKNKKMRFFLMSQGSLDPKIRFIGQKVCSVARVQTGRQTRKWIQRTPFQGFRNFPFNLSSRIGPIYVLYLIHIPILVLIACIVFFCIVLCYIVCIVLYNIELYCIILCMYCIVLLCIVMYYIFIVFIQNYQ